MSLKNGNRNNKINIKEKFKEVWSVKEFKWGICILVALILILILQLTGVL